MHIVRSLQSFSLYINGMLSLAKADTGPARRALAPCLKFLVNFDCISHIYFYCSHHKVLTICTLFSTVTKKHRVCVKRISTRGQEFYRAGTAPPSDFEIPGSTTDLMAQISYTCTA